MYQLNSMSLSPRTPTSGRARRSGQPTPQNTVEREKAMRDYKLSIEYKHLKQHCPGGVYLVPSYDDLRLFHGVIFVRRGAYTNGIYKFTLQCPPTYNDQQTHPKVTFSSYVYSPHVNADTGEIDLSTAYPTWDPSKHFLVTVLTYLKRIFYVKDYKELSQEQRNKLPNQEALNLFQTDQEGYRRRVNQCVTESQRSIYLNDGSTLNFKEESAESVLLRDMMKQKFSAVDSSGTPSGKVEDVAKVVTKEDTMNIIQQIVQQQGAH